MKRMSDAVTGTGLVTAALGACCMDSPGIYGYAAGAVCILGGLIAVAGCVAEGSGNGDRKPGRPVRSRQKIRKRRNSKMSNITFTVRVEGLDRIADAVMKLAQALGGQAVTGNAAQTAPETQNTVPAVPQGCSPEAVHGGWQAPQGTGTVTVPAVPVQNAPASGVPAVPVQNAPASGVPVQNAPVQNVPAPGVPVQNAPATAQVPVAGTPVQTGGTSPAGMPVQGTVPTATAVPAPYTFDELAVAASQLVNMGKQPRLLEILHGFGVGSLMELPQEKYGAFAGCLKTEGVKF